MGQQLVDFPVAAVRFVVEEHQLSDAGVEALTRSPLLAQLNTLVLRHNQITNAGVIALASSPATAGLARLDLSDNRILAEGALALARSPYLCVTELQLWGNYILPPAVQALRERFGTHVLIS